MQTIVCGKYGLARTVNLLAIIKLPSRCARLNRAVRLADAIRARKHVDGAANRRPLRKASGRLGEKPTTVGSISGMSKTKLTFASGLYDRMQPLYTGEVKLEGFELDFRVVEWSRENLRSDGRQAGVRRGRILQFRADQQNSRRQVSVRRDPGLSVAHVSAWIHLHQSPLGYQRAERSRGQLWRLTEIGVKAYAGGRSLAL